MCASWLQKNSTLLDEKPKGNDMILSNLIIVIRILIPFSATMKKIHASDSFFRLRRAFCFSMNKKNSWTMSVNICCHTSYIPLASIFKISSEVSYKTILFGKSAGRVGVYNIKHNLTRSCFQLWPSKLALWATKCWRKKTVSASTSLDLFPKRKHRIFNLRKDSSHHLYNISQVIVTKTGKILRIAGNFWFPALKICSCGVVM